MRGSHCASLASLALALLAALLAVGLPGARAGLYQQSAAIYAVGDGRLGGLNSVAAGSQFDPVSLNDPTLKEVADFLVFEINRRESSTAGVRSLRSVLAASQQTLVTGHVYHTKVVMHGGVRGTEVVDAAVLDSKIGTKNVMQFKTTKATAMDLHDISVLESKLEKLHGTGAAPAAADPFDADAEAEFDVAFLDGIEVDSHNANAGGSLSNLSRSGDAAAAEAVRLLKMQASMPLPSANARPKNKSRLTKAY